MEGTFKLTPEEERALRDQHPKIRAAEDVLTRLEKIGVPVEQQRADLDRAKEIRQGLLDEFARTGRPRRKP